VKPVAARAARPAPRLKGRYWVALWLALFLGAAAVVQWRQTRAHALARDLTAITAARGALEVSTATLTGRIHRARSRAVLVPLAERRLGLRLPADSEIVILQAPAAPRPARPR
jgi:hypothetical protein